MIQKPATPFAGLSLGELKARRLSILADLVKATSLCGRIKKADYDEITSRLCREKREIEAMIENLAGCSDS